MTKSTPLVRIVDDDAEARASTAFYLSLLGWEIAQYEDAEAFLNGQDDGSRPGCLLLDVRMPKMTGLELQEKLNERGCRLPIVFLSGHGDINMAVTALQRGAMTFLEKSYKPEDIQEAVRKAVDKSLADASVFQEKEESQRLYDSLTDREKEVAELMTEGCINKVIADRLGITERTVKMHRANVYLKLDLKSTAELTKFLSKIH